MVQFMSIMILEIYLPCYYATEITLNSADLCTRIYCSNWEDQSIATRKLIILYMEFLKHPVQLKATNFFDVGLPIFTKACIGTCFNRNNNLNSIFLFRLWIIRTDSFHYCLIWNLNKGYQCDKGFKVHFTKIMQYDYRIFEYIDVAYLIFKNAYLAKPLKCTNWH